MNLREVISKLKGERVKRVLIQIPDGLRVKSVEILKEIESNGIEAVLWAEHTYGACDIPENEAKKLGCDAILHFGHEDFGVKTSLKVFYFPIFYPLELKELKKEVRKISNYKRLCLLSSVQFTKNLKKVKEILEEEGFSVIVPKVLKIRGMILGCTYNFVKNMDKKIDAYLIITSGKFHGLAIALKSSKKVFVYDVEKKKIINLEEEKKRLKKIIEWNKSKFKEAKKIGLLISVKAGQFQSPHSLKKKIESLGKEVYVFVMNEITPEKLEGLDVDLFINTACPRIGMEDLPNYKKPILNAEEILDFL